LNGIGAIGTFTEDFLDGGVARPFGRERLARLFEPLRGLRLLAPKISELGLRFFDSCA
jgi:hypothetical protein